MHVRKFSRIYVEERIRYHQVTRSILDEFPDSRIIPIRHYKDVFSRPGQDFAAQKASQQLILAQGRPPFLYKGAEVCPSFGNPAFYYASSVMNCIYDCGYCYLQGMYPCANLVVFVNIEDIFRETDRGIASLEAEKKSGKNSDAPLLYVCNSYDTDLLALRGIIPLADRWLDFAATRPELLVEMRTKSAGTSWIRTKKPADNVIIAWTLSPEQVACAFEPGAPPLKARIKAAGVAMEQGWRVRICIDPMLFVKEWEELYTGLADLVHQQLDADLIENVSFGVFRMGRDFLKRARTADPKSDILHYPFCLKDGVYTYPEDITKQMLNVMNTRLSAFLPDRKLFPQETAV